MGLRCSFGSVAASTDESPDAVRYRLLHIWVLRPKGKQCRDYVKAQGFGRGGLNLTKERRRCESSKGQFHEVRYQVACELLGALRVVGASEQWRGLAQGQENLILSKSLEHTPLARRDMHLAKGVGVAWYFIPWVHDQSHVWWWN